jgi:hypothetical protein
MIYGDLRLRDRLLRALIGAILGAGAGFLLMFRWDMFGTLGADRRSTLLLPSAGVGGLIGALLAFRRRRI